MKIKYIIILHTFKVIAKANFNLKQIKRNKIITVQYEKKNENSIYIGKQ